MTEAGGDFQDLRQYKFLNLRAYINFTVTAVNIVGDGESTSIVSEPCENPGGTNEDLSHQTVLAVVSFDSRNTPALSMEVIVSVLL